MGIRIPAGRDDGRGREQAAGHLPAVPARLLPALLLAAALSGPPTTAQPQPVQPQPVQAQPIQGAPEIPAAAPDAAASGTPAGAASETAADGAAADGAARPLPRPGAPPAADPARAADLFARPAIAATIRQAFALAAAGDPGGARQLIAAARARHPDLADLAVAQAGLAMRAGDRAAALAALAEAAPGLADPAALGTHPLFAPLAADPARAALFTALLETHGTPPPRPVPVRVAAHRAPVLAANTAWDGGAERLVARFAFPETSAAPVLPSRPRTAAHELLRDHARAGRAAGNLGDLYDNRDRGHSALDPEAHPQLAHVAYSPAARAAGLDYGLGDRLLFNAPTFGNSSTAVTGGPHWRSLPRLALTRPDGTGPMRLWQTAQANHLYIHPAHRDFGAEDGDLFPANTPYLLVSRGSSGSDRPFLEAVAMILAAFRPDTKARLVEAGLVVPTVQMVFRRSLQSVRSRADYFSGLAHPAAFDGFDINLARMVSLANAIAPGDIPAEVRLRVEAEELGREGVDFFGQGLSEQLFDTPGAIARIWRSKAGRRSMIVSAADSRDANDRDLSFHWHLLQGDPEKVAIEPLDGGTRARITLDWHDPFPISDELLVMTSRVDIGVFAHNGAHDSAPAILSWSFPAHEARTYEPGPDGAPRIVEIDRRPKARQGIYADPLLHPRARWRDVFAYDADGALSGWTRHRADRTDRFTAQGLRRTDEGGLEPVTYMLRQDGRGRLRIAERPRP